MACLALVACGEPVEREDDDDDGGSSGSTGGASASTSGAGGPSSSSGSSADCGAVAAPAVPGDGCAIRLVTPTVCEEIDLTGGKTYEFAWTTDGTFCETPWTVVASGNPPSEQNAVSVQLSENVEQGISHYGGVIYVGAADLASLTSDNGLYHWVVAGWYGSHPDSQTFRPKL